VGVRGVVVCRRVGVGVRNSGHHGHGRREDDSGVRCPCRQKQGQLQGSWEKEEAGGDGS
jgi:hypothetical protein